MTQKTFDVLLITVKIILIGAGMCYFGYRFAPALINLYPHRLLIKAYKLSYFMVILAFTCSALLLHILSYYQKKKGFIISSGLFCSKANPYALIDKEYLVFLWWWILTFSLPLILRDFNYVWANMIIKNMWNIAFCMACTMNFRIAPIKKIIRYQKVKTKKVELPAQPFVFL